MACLDYLNTISGDSSHSYGSNITVEALHKASFREPAVIDHDHNFGIEFQNMLAAQQGMDRQGKLLSAIGDELEKYNAHRFIPLVTTASEANVAIALYAGEGIVIKITKSTEFSGTRGAISGAYTALPYVLPPITSTNIGEYTVEMFPWVNTFNITDKDVETLRVDLAKYNMAFHPKDAKPNNIGILPDGSLVVLDGDAVGVKDPTKPIPTYAINQWLDKVYSEFGPLYRAKDPATLISAKPDFSLSFSPLVKSSKPDMTRVDSGQEIASIPPGDIKPSVRRGFSWFNWGEAAMNEHRSHSDTLRYSFKLLRGEDAHGAPCYSFVLFPPEQARRGVAANDGNLGMVIYSGWGEPTEYDIAAAQERLQQDYLR